MNETIEEEQAEWTQRRIECRHHAALLFDSVEDLKWLYFDLALKGVFVDWSMKVHELEDLVREPIWASLSDKKYELDTLTEQAVRYIDKPLFHCTALRDFFIVRLTGCLTNLVADDPMPLITNRLWPAFAVAVAGLITSALLWTFANWWSAVLVIVLTFLIGRQWGRKYESNSRNKYSRRHIQVHETRDAILRISERVRRGGFDEPTIIHQLEIYDIKLPLPQPVVVHNGTPFVMTIDGTPIAVKLLVRIPIPDVLYALLRLPRRNVESENTKNFAALNDSKKKEIFRQWRNFVDGLHKYDEPRADSLLAKSGSGGSV